MDRTIIKSMLSDEELQVLLDETHFTHYPRFLNYEEYGWRVVLVRSIDVRKGQKIWERIEKELRPERAFSLFGED